MNIDDAIHLTTSEYPGGAEALAMRMGQDPAQFRSKANPSIERAYFRPRDLVQMQQLSGTTHILHSMADDLDHICLPKPDLGDEGAMEAITRLAKEFSDVLNVATKAMADGKLSHNERRKLQKELLDLIASSGMVIPALEHAGKRK